MPPKIATILVLLFVLFLLRMDHVKNKGLGIDIWLPTLWLGFVASRAPSLWFFLDAPARTTSFIEGSPFDRNVFLSMILIGIYILIRRREFSWSKMIDENKIAILFFLYLGLSTLWSDYSFVSFKRWIKEIGNVVMVLVVLTHPDPKNSLLAIFRRCSYILIPVSILFVKYYPDLGRNFTQMGELSYVGVALQKNGLGLLCLIFSLFFFYYLFIYNHYKSKIDKERFFQLLVLGMGFWLFSISNSSTSLGCFIMGLLIIIGVGFTSIRNNVERIGKIILSLLVLFMFLQYTFNITENIIVSLGRDLTLTGRTDIWTEVLDIGTNPYVGSGYESYWLGDHVDELKSRLSFNINQSHNGYLETYLNLGGIGVFLLVLLLLSTFNKIKNRLNTDFQFGRLQLSIFVIMLVYNITEAAFKGFSFIWFTFLLTCVFKLGSEEEETDNA